MNKLNLRKKLLLGLTMIITVLIVILAYAFYNYLSTETINEEYKTSQRITERTSAQIDELFKQMDMAALFIVKNSVIQTVLSNLQNQENISDYAMINYQAMANDQLKILSFYFPNITNASIFNAKRPFYFHSGLPLDNNVVKERLKDLSWYENLVPPDRQLRILPTHQDYWVSISRPVISVVRRLVTPSKEDLGMFEIDIPYWNLQNICDSNTVSDESNILVFDGNGALVHPIEYDTGANSVFGLISPSKIYELIKNGGSTAGQFKVSGSEILYTSHQSNFTDLHVVMVKKESTLQKQLAIYSLFIIIAGLIILLAVSLAFFVLVRSLTKPLYQLTATIEDVSLDNMNLEIPHEGQDELKMLNESFNAMFIKLKDSINLVYESKIREINANLLALQAQINPHFLYNTLGVISASSEKFGNSETASMCNKLSAMMRYIVSPTDSMVTIREEVNHTLNYLNLMENHYQDYKNNSGSFLKYAVNIPEEMSGIRLPKMILQPIVENCINHGFENKLPPWHIEITGYYKSVDHWHISVVDNGTGFDEIVLDQINADMAVYRTNIKDGNLKQNLHIGGMGIINTFARLAINFKEDTVFEIGNSQEKGCIVKFGRRNSSEEVC